MGDLWERIERLKGQPLYGRRKRTFTVEDVSDKGLTLRLSSGSRAYSTRTKVEAAYQLVETAA